MKQEIEAKIEEANNEILRLENQINTLKQQIAIERGRVEAFIFSLSLVPAISQAGGPPWIRAAKKQSRGRKASAPKDLRAVFQRMGIQNNFEFGYDAIMEMGSHLGIEIAKNSLRSRMSILVKDGNFERVGRGEFRVTNKGIEYFELGDANAERKEKPFGAPTPKGSDFTGEAVTSPDVDDESQDLLG